MFCSLPDIGKLTYNDITSAGYNVLFLEISDTIYCMWGDFLL